MPDIFPKSVIKYVCYHGTNVAKIDELDKSKIQKDYRDGSDSGYLGWGFYLTKSKEYAFEFGDNILEFNVDIQNPFKPGRIDINYKDLINFIFEDCEEKELQENIQNSLPVIKNIGKGNYGDFKNEPKKEISLECRRIYIKYLDKKLNKKDIENIKNIFILLAKNEDNWLNGLFFYFGKQLFHYITFNGYDGVIAKDGIEIVVYETKQIYPINKNSIEEDLELDTSEELIPLGYYWFNISEEDRNLCGKTIYNSKTKKYGVVNSCGYQYIDVIYKGNKSSVRYHIWKDDSVTTSNDKVVTNNIFIAPHINWQDKFEEELDLDLDSIKTFYNAKVGDKFKIKETNDICTITNIKLLNNDTLLIDYDYDTYIEDAPSCGSFKYRLGGNNSFANNVLEII